MNENLENIWLGMFAGAIITIIILSIMSITISNHGFTAKQKLELIQIIKEYK